MLVRIVIAAMASAILMSSCEWLFPKKKEASAFNIQGTWKFDSLSSPKDSGTGLAFLALARALNDSSGTGDIHLTTTFDTATTTVVSNVDGKKPDTAAYALDGGKMRIKSHDEKQVVDFNPVNDSSFVLRDDDSTAFFYSRVK